jgi:rare lipoprotein A
MRLNGGESRVAEATYYDLAGRTTASGVVMDPLAYTCAHRTLRFGDIVKIERLDHPGRLTRFAVVTDRGPWPSKPSEKNREVDLSWAVGRDLLMLKTGVAKIKYTVIGHTDTFEGFRIRTKQQVLDWKKKTGWKSRGK